MTILIACTFQALVTLFVLATRDGWVTVMHYGVDAVGVDSQVNIVVYYYSILYIILYIFTI